MHSDALAAHEEDRASDAWSDATSTRTRRSAGADKVNDDLRSQAVQDALDERFQDLLKKCLGNGQGLGKVRIRVLLVVVVVVVAAFWDANVLERWKVCGGLW